MTARRKDTGRMGLFAARSRAAGFATVSESVRATSDDQADREALERARDKLDAGELETIGHAEIKARLGLT